MNKHLYISYLEKGKKVFLNSNFRKKQQTNNTINKIKDENGIKYTSTTEIIDVLMTFYDKLYTNNDIIISIVLIVKKSVIMKRKCVMKYQH